MIQIEIFDDVFAFNARYSYPQAVQNEIKNNRSTLQKLFFDRLLDALHINASHLYPPRTNSDLRALHKEVVSAQIADHLKQSVLYYILKDCRSKSEIAPADVFSTSSYIPDKFSICIDGLWHMDRLKFESAMEYLTLPSLVPTFPAEVLSTLLAHASDTHLPLSYYHAVSPPLNSEEVVASFVAYLTSSVSVTDAYFFVRRQPSHLHHQLLDTLIETGLSGPANDAKAARGMELVNLPLDGEEENWMEDFLEGKGRKLPGAIETSMIRKMGTGRLNKAAEGNAVGGSGRKAAQLENVREGLRRGLGPRTVPDAISIEDS